MIHDARVLNQELATRFDRWLKVQEYTESTNVHYLRAIVALCRFVGDLAVTDMTHLDVRDFLASIAQREVKSATLWQALNALRCFFDFLNMGGLVAWSPPRFVRLPKKRRHSVSCSVRDADAITRQSSSGPKRTRIDRSLLRHRGQSRESPLDPRGRDRLGRPKNPRGRKDRIPLRPVPSRDYSNTP